METQRISIFPLAGALLLPGMHLPLHIFEPRYRSLVSDALVRGRQIGMVQPRDNDEPPALFDVGCHGRIAEVQAMEDGRYNILLEGLARFRIVEELDVTTPFRQVRATLFDESGEGEPMPAILRAAIEAEARVLAERLGYQVDWGSVSALDDETFVNAVAQVAPFDVAAKQMLLEAPDVATRADIAEQLLHFINNRPDPDSPRATLQ